MTGGPAVLDTSVLIARETRRRLDVASVPDQTAIGVVTPAELHASVLVATDTITRTRRLAALVAVSVVEALPVTAEAARRWAALRVRLAEEGCSAKTSDLWIAAIASANDVDIASQDDDFNAIESVGGPHVIRVCAGRSRKPPLAQVRQLAFGGVPLIPGHPAGTATTSAESPRPCQAVHRWLRPPTVLRPGLPSKVEPDLPAAAKENTVAHNDDHSAGDGRKPYSDQGGTEGRHAQTHDVAREAATNSTPSDNGPDEFANDLANDKR